MSAQQPAELTRTGWAAFGQSLKILGTCIKEAPEFAAQTPGGRTACLIHGL